MMETREASFAQRGSSGQRLASREQGAAQESQGNVCGDEAASSSCCSDSDSDRPPSPKYDEAFFFVPKTARKSQRSSKNRRDRTSASHRSQRMDKSPAEFSEKAKAAASNTAGMHEASGGHGSDITPRDALLNGGVLRPSSSDGRTGDEAQGDDTLLLLVPHSVRIHFFLSANEYLHVQVITRFNTIPCMADFRLRQARHGFYIPISTEAESSRPRLSISDHSPWEQQVSDPCEPGRLPGQFAPSRLGDHPEAACAVRC